MKYVLAIGAVLVFLVGAISFGAWIYIQRLPHLEPLGAGVAGKTEAPLPKDAIVLTIAEGAEVEAPFALGDDLGAVGGVAAVLPKGSRTEAHKGKVKFKAKTENAGSYTAWIHARWRDTCSNSVALKVGEGVEQLVGNDDVFSAWHWVPAAKHNFVAGENAVALVEREDGILIDQILFTQDAAYQPMSAISPSSIREVRRFADTFMRSPGHGNEAWELVSGDWQIQFSFDPNRVPNQYAWIGEAKGGEAISLVKGAPWFGCKFAYSFQPSTDGRYGAVLDRQDKDKGMFAGFEIKDGKAFAFVDGGGVSERAEVTGSVRLNQWHRVVVERWAWIVRVFVDGRAVLSSYKAAPKSGKAGFFVTSGTAVFDDLNIEEIAWQADNGGDLKLSWSVENGGEWFRSSDPEAPMAMIGKRGTVKAGLGGLLLEEVVVEDAPAAAEQACAACKLTADGLSEFAAAAQTGTRVLRLPDGKLNGITHAVFEAAQPESRIKRVALRYGRREAETFAIGPYTFAEEEMEDPSDYLDFTPEEYQKMANSPDAEKLRRVPKMKPVIGRGGEDESPWEWMGGLWRVRNGALLGSGQNARLRHTQEIAGDMEMRFKVKLYNAASAGEVELYGGADPGLRVGLSGKKADANAALPAGVAAVLNLPADGNFHNVQLQARGKTLSVKVDREPQREVAFKRVDGDRMFLKIASGTLEFDDVEFIVDRNTQYYYPFNRPETDWWRESDKVWVDHGGIACVLASNWISLISPHERGRLWNKHIFKESNSNLMLAFNVEENTQWNGWDKYPSHVHFPFENVEAVLASEADENVNYTLKVNAERHSATILYRNGKEVARVRQDRSFPMVYHGGHAPFYPRTNRIAIVKRGGLIRGMVNGREVVRFDDPEPLNVTRVGVGGHDTRVNFSHIEIRLPE